MTGDEISGLVDKVAEKLGVASEQVIEAVEVLAVEYQTANIVAAVCCIGALGLVILLGAWMRALGRRQAKLEARGNDWILGTFVASWFVTLCAVILCLTFACLSIYDALMPRVALLAKLGLLR